jgi:hypothetical protein
MKRLAVLAAELQAEKLTSKDQCELKKKFLCLQVFI